MADTCDVVVSAGTANVSAPWRIPELGKTLDFLSGAEHEIKGMSHTRVMEWEQLGFEISVTRGDDPRPAPHPKPKKAEKEEKPKGKAG